MKYKCVSCKSDNTVDHGMIDNDTYYIECKDCGFQFTVKELTGEQGIPLPNINRFRGIVEKTVKCAIHEFLAMQSPAMTNSAINEEIRHHGTIPIEAAIQSMKKRMKPWLASVLADNHGFDMDPAAPETPGFEGSADDYIENW